MKIIIALGVRMRFVVVALVALMTILYGISASTVPIRRDVSVLWSLACTPAIRPTWLKGDRSALPRPMPKRWSPFMWCSNASIIAGHAKDLPSEEIKTLSTILLEMLDKNSHDVDGRRYTFYDFDYQAAHYPMVAPWYSALGNGFAAIGLMHLSDATGDRTLMAQAHRYLQSINSPTLSYWLDGDFWFSEYAASLENPRDHGVINGHFAAIGALHEWQHRTGSHEFSGSIANGLRTMERWLPRVMMDGYFAYARETPNTPDYGQQRAVNQARAAYELTGSARLRAIAEKYEHEHNNR